ncbi:Hypothetical protein A7982_11401 [Minicystis rosea]|nr:Hypothetical protein A7982_11401 [Minicystis rosea]
MKLRLVRWAFAAGLLLALLAPARARACSLSSDFLPPSNYELVRLAEQVVLARAVSATSQDVTFEVVETLRGSALRPKDAITLQGFVARYAGPSPVDDFSRARPGASAGACIAYDYRVGGQFLLLLRGSASKWATLGTPFARVNEEVTAPNDPWLAAVRHYARIAGLADPVKERAALEALRVAAEKHPSPSQPAALAADIERHARTPNVYKTFAELKAMYDAAPPDHTKSRALLAITLRGDPAAGPLLAQLLKQAQGDPPRSAALLPAIAHYYDKVPDSQSLSALAELYVKLGTGMKHARWEIMWTLIRRAAAEHRPAMQKALESADEEEAGRLAAWFVRYPSPEAQAYFTKLVRGDYENKSEITFALAGMGAKAPLDWALSMLKTPSPPQGAGSTQVIGGSTKPDTRWMAPYVVARSPLPEADVAAGAIIRARRQDFIMLLQGYDGATHANAERRLKEISAISDLNDEERNWLDRTKRARAATP